MHDITDLSVPADLCLGALHTEERHFVLDARFDHGGAWAGVEPLVDAAWRALTARGCDDLLHRHHYALHLVLQDRRAVIPLVYASLTDIAVGAERTRNFPLDRAHRIVNALVELVIAWRRMEEPAQWIMLARGFDAAQALGRRFFSELARRAAGEILVVVECGESLSVLGDAAAAVPPAILAAARAPLAGHDLAAAAALLAVHGDLKGEPALIERCHPILLALHRDRGDGLAAAGLALRTLCLYNHFGYYEESGSFANAVLGQFDAIVGDDQDLRWNCIGNIFQGLVMIGRQDEARAIIEARALPYLTRADLRAKMHYVLAMYHLRYSTAPDMALAEHHIDAARAAIAVTDETVDRADRLFFAVFIDNGLAFLRVRQGRPNEALALCQSGHARLVEGLGEARHRLHRSVLQYNCAQVYAQLGRLDEALRFYGYAMEIDPYYSEYYNEVGNILQRQGRYDDARGMYDLAERYSAPYPELFYNRAVCEAQGGDWAATRASLTRSLDLDPAQPDAFLLRADALGMLGLSDYALGDLDAAIALAPENATARVNRAVLRFERADYVGALADMDRAIALEPAMADNFDNRAAVFDAIGHSEHGARDRSTAEALRLAA